MIELPAPLRSPGIRLMESLRKTDALALLPDLLASERWPLAQLEALQAENLAARDGEGEAVEDRAAIAANSQVCDREIHQQPGVRS